MHYYALSFNLVTGTNSFFILPNQVKKFEGVYTVPADISLVGIFPHMHYLGKNWEVYIENPDGSKTNLIKINDWDFNWQGGYYFDKYKIAKKGSKIHAFATYDNTESNPANPNNPPKFVTWGEGTKDEMYYLPLLYVPYKTGDENVVFDQNTSSAVDIMANEPLLATIYPNPTKSGDTYPVHINFQLKNGMPVRIEVFNINGQVIRVLRDHEYFSQGSHIVHLQANQLQKGMYFVKLSSDKSTISLPLLITD